MYGSDLSDATVTTENVSATAATVAPVRCTHCAPGEGRNAPGDTGYVPAHLRGPGYVSSAPGVTPETLESLVNGPDLVTIDPRELAAARETIEQLTNDLRDATNRGDTLSRALNHERERLAALDRKMDEIRDYVIERNRAGDICREGTDRFLYHFDFDPIEREFVVTTTITVTQTITAGDDDDAGDMAEQNIRDEASSFVRNFSFDMESDVEES